MPALLTQSGFYVTGVHIHRQDGELSGAGSTAG